MKSIFVGALVGATALLACSDDPAPTVVVLPAAPADAGTDAQGPKPDGGGDGGGESDAGRLPPVFLPQSDYADYIAIDPAFPFDVTQVHVSPAAVDDARWGRGGPMVTTLVGGKPAVLRYTVPAAPKGPLTHAVINYAEAPNLPAQKFFNGMVDLPVGQRSLLSYTGSGATFPGEVLLYGSSLMTVDGRADVNGYFGGVGLAKGAETRYVYSALSPFANGKSATNENGLYVSDSCGGALTPTGTCKPGFAVIRWAGYSGPVTTDAQDNVFVAASLTGGASSDGIFALTKREALDASAPISKDVLFASDTGGTASIAALAPEGAAEGWVLVKGYDFPAATTTAFSYAVGASVTGGTKKVAAALKAGAKMTGEGTGYALFADPEGDLWVAANTSAGPALLELRRKP